MINDAFSALERMERAAFKSGTFLLLLSGALLFFIWVGSIRPDAFWGNAKDGAFAVFAVGCGLVVLSALRTVFSLLVRGLTYPFRKMSEKKYKARELVKLQENVRYLPTELERLVLFACYLQPSHRMPMFAEYGFFSRLITYQLLQYEVDSGLLGPGHAILQLNELMADDHEFWSTLRQHLAEIYGADFDDDIWKLIRREYTPPRKLWV